MFDTITASDWFRWGEHLRLRKLKETRCLRLEPHGARCQRLEPSLEQYDHLTVTLALEDTNEMPSFTLLITVILLTY